MTNNVNRCALTLFGLSAVRVNKHADSITPEGYAETINSHYGTLWGYWYKDLALC